MSVGIIHNYLIKVVRLLSSLARSKPFSRQAMRFNTSIKFHVADIDFSERLNSTISARFYLIPPTQIMAHSNQHQKYYSKMPSLAFFFIISNIFFYYFKHMPKSDKSRQRLPFQNMIYSRNFNSSNNRKTNANELWAIFEIKWEWCEIWTNRYVFLNNDIWVMYEIKLACFRNTKWHA